MSLLFFQFWRELFFQSSVESYKSEEETIVALEKSHKKTLAKKESFVIYLILLDEWNLYDICSWTSLEIIFYIFFKKLYLKLYLLYFFSIFILFVPCSEKEREKIYIWRS